MCSSSNASPYTEDRARLSSKVTTVNPAKATSLRSYFLGGLFERPPPLTFFVVLGHPPALPGPWPLPAPGRPPPELPALLLLPVPPFGMMNRLCLSGLLD